MELSFSYNQSLASPEKIEEYLALLSPEIARIASIFQKTINYTEPLRFVQLPFDEQYHKKIAHVAQEKKELKPSLVLLIGIGGSSLGTLALHEALNGVYANHHSDKQFYCADTLDPEKIEELQKICTAVLEAKKNVLVIIVTKSGTTTETLCNAAIFIGLLKQYHPQNYHKYLTFITDKNSPLWERGVRLGVACLEVPQQVGGRYSVFSAVGLFPLRVLGVDTSALCAGAQDAVKQCTALDRYNYAAVSAAFLFFHYQSGTRVHDTFLFDARLESVGKWYRQLMAESLGKDRQGMLPTVSMGTVDLHSMVQLYLGGPAMSMTTFVTTKPSAQQIVIPQSAPLAGEPVAKVLHAIADGVQQTYFEQGLPAVSFTGLKKEPYDLGFFLQLKMLEIIYVGYLMEINPFDQPEVELYKTNVRELLKNG